MAVVGILSDGQGLGRLKSSVLSVGSICFWLLRRRTKKKCSEKSRVSFRCDKDYQYCICSVEDVCLVDKRAGIYLTRNCINRCHKSENSASQQVLGSS